MWAEGLGMLLSPTVTLKPLHAAVGAQVPPEWVEQQGGEGSAHAPPAGTGCVSDAGPLSLSLS